MRGVDADPLVEVHNGNLAPARRGTAQALDFCGWRARTCAGGKGGAAGRQGHPAPDGPWVCGRQDPPKTSRTTFSQAFFNVHVLPLLSALLNPSMNNFGLDNSPPPLPAGGKRRQRPAARAPTAEAAARSSRRHLVRLRARRIPCRCATKATRTMILGRRHVGLPSLAPLQHGLVSFALYVRPLPHNASSPSAAPAPQQHLAVVRPSSSRIRASTSLRACSPPP